MISSACTGHGTWIPFLRRAARVSPGMTRWIPAFAGMTKRVAASGDMEKPFSR
jgi:hypothetical protein